MRLHVWRDEHPKLLLELTLLPEEAISQPHIYKEEVESLNLISRNVFMTICRSLSVNLLKPLQ